MKCHGMIIYICRSDHTVLLQVNKSERTSASKNKKIKIIAARHGLQELSYCYAEYFHLLPSEQTYALSGMVVHKLLYKGNGHYTSYVKSRVMCNLCKEIELVVATPVLYYHAKSGFYNTI